MNTKLLLILSWLFYLAARHTADTIWIFCLALSSALTVGTFFYQLENKPDGTRPKKKSKARA